MIKKSLATLIAVLHLLTFSTVHAYADGPVITDVNGNVISQTNGDVTTVTLQNGQQYTWTGDLAANESIYIEVLNAIGVADASAAALVEAVGGETALAGVFDLLGTMGFVNTAGFNIADTFQANIDGGLVLSTLGIDPSEFFAGTAELARGLQDAAAIINNGDFNISPGSFLALIASSVQNSGNIVADGGAAILAAGDKVTLDISGGKGLIAVEVNEAVEAEVYDFEGNKIADAINNSGTIQANGGMAVLTAAAAEDVMDNVINHTGVIEANSIREENGVIILDGGDQGVTRVSGDLYAQGDDLGETGGSISVLGDKVGVFGDAIIEASGYDGGGEVLIGGNYQGLGSERNSSATYVSPDAVVKADAILDGDGGKVIVWSDGTTRAYGTFSAQGGNLSGDGGFIEVSGKEYLDINGINVSATATNGAAGTVLFDPRNLTVVAADTAAPDAPDTDAGADGVFTPNMDDSEVLVATINGILDAGNNVELNTGVTGAQAGNISIEAAITKSAGAASTLTVNAANNITITATGGIAAVGAFVLNVIMNAGGAIAINGGSQIDANGGNVTAVAGGAITGTDDAVADIIGAIVNLTATAIGASAVDITSTSDLIIDTSAVNGKIEVDHIGSGISALDIDAGTGNVTLNVAGGVDDNDANVDIIGGTVVVNLTAAGNFGDTDTAAGNAIQTTATNLSVDTSANNGNQFIRETDGVTLGLLKAGTGNVSVEAGGTLDAVDDITSDIEANDVNLTATQIGGAASAIDITVNGTMTLDTSAANGNIRTDSTAVTINTVNAGTGDVTLQSIGLIRDAVGNDTTVDVTGNNVTLNSNFAGGIGTSATDSVNVNATTLNTDTSGINGNQFITEADNVAIGSMNAGTGNVTLSAVGNITSAADDAVADITGGIVSLVAAAIGASAVDVAASTKIDADTSASNGKIEIDGIGGFPIGNLNAGTGNVLIQSTTGFTDADADAAVDVTGQTLNATADAGAFGAAAGNNAIDTTVTNIIVNTSAGNGSQFINETDGLSNLDLNAGTGDVTLTAGGSVTDALADGADIQATNLTGTITGAFGVAANAIETTVTNISVDTSGVNGEQSIAETDALAVGLLNAGTGNVNVTAGGALTSQADDATADIVGNAVNLTAASIGASAVDVTSNTSLFADTSGSNGKIEIDHIGSGISALNLNAGTGNVILDVAGGVDDNDVNVDITAGDAAITLSAAGNFGDTDTATGNAIQTNVTSLSIDSSANNGNQFIRETDGVALGSLNAGTGNVNMFAGGAITSQADDATADITAGIISLVATAIGASAVDMSAGTRIDIDTSASNGKIEVDGIGGFPIGNLNAGTGNVILQSTTGFSDADLDGAVDITGTDLTAIADNGAFGSGAGFGGIDTTVASASVNTSAANGLLVLNESNTLTDLDLNAGTGAVSLSAGGDVTDTAADGVDIQAGNFTGAVQGNFGAAANAIETTVTNISLNTSTANGNQVITETDGLALGLLNAGTGDVTITAGGAVTSQADDGVADVVADELSITATAIGASAIDVTLATALNIDTSAANGKVEVDSIGALPVGVVNAGTGAVTLEVETANDAMTDANDGGTPDAPGVLNVTGGVLQFNSNGGDIGALNNKLEINPSTSWGATTNGGGLHIACTGDCPLGVVDVGTATFTFSSAGNITDANDAVTGEFNAGNVNITAGGLVLEAATGIGTSTNAIETRLSDFNGVANTNGRAELDGGTGGVFLANAAQTGAGLTLGGVGVLAQAVAAQAGVQIFSGSPLDIAANVIDNGGGNILLTALGNAAADDITVNANVTASGGNGNIEMYAGDSVLFQTAGATVSAAGTGNVSIHSGEDFTDATVNQDGNAAGAIDMNAAGAAAVTSTNGVITLDSATGVTNIQGVATAGDVTVTARNGNITQRTDDATADISGATVTLNAVNGQIGASAIDVTATTRINADTSTSNGKIEIDSIGNFPIGNINAGTGQVTLGSTLGYTDADADAAVDITGQALIAVAANGGFGAAGGNNAIDTDLLALVTNTAAGNGNQFINEASGLNGISLQAGTGDVTLTTGGDVLDGDGAVDVVATNFLGTIAGAFGAAGAANAIQTTVASLSVNSSGSNGNQFITETDGLTDLDLNAGTGNVTLNASGAIVDTAADGADIQGTNAAVTIGGGGGDFGQVANTIETAVSDLSVDTSANNNSQFTTEADGLTELNLNAGTGQVNLATTGAGDVLSNDAAVDIAGGTVSVIVGNGAFGDTDTAAGNAIETTATDLSVNTVGGNGNQFIRESDGLTELLLNAGTGNVSLATAAAGNVLSNDAAVDILGNVVDVTVAGGTFGDTDTAAGNAIETTVTQLSVNTSAGNGSQFIRETDNVALGLLNAGNGDVNLNAGGIVSAVADDATADIVGATVNVVATQFGASAVDVTVGTQFNVDTSAANGKIEADSIGDLPVGLLNAGTGSVLVESTGNITDANDGGTPDAPAVNNIIGGIISLIAQVGGIGAGGNFLDFLASNNFSARTDPGVGGDNGNIFVRSKGNAPINIINAGTGNVDLDSEGNITDFNNDNNANVIGGTLSFETLNGDDIGQIINFFDIQPSVLYNVTTNGGNAFINCIGPCPVGQVDVGTALYAHMGSITDGNDAVNGERVAGGDWNIRAGGLHIQGAGNSIGTAANWIETRLQDPNGVAGDGQLQVDGAGVFISNTGGLGLDPNSGLDIINILPATFGLPAAPDLPLTDGITSTGGIVIDSNSPVNVNADILDNAGNDIFVNANGTAGTDDVNVNAGRSISASGGNGNVTVIAGDDVNMAANSLISATGTGTVNVGAGEDGVNGMGFAEADGSATGDVVMNASAAIRSADGNVNVRSTQHSQISEVNANSNADGTRGDVTVTADTNANGTGRIEDENGATVNITADDATLRAGSGIGVDGANTKETLETDIVRLDSINSTSGHVVINEVAAGGPLGILRAFQQGAGDHEITTTNGTLTVLAAAAGGLGVTSTTGVTLLQANGGGNDDDLVLNHSVMSTTGKINLDSTSRDVIADANGDVTATGGGEIESSAQRNITQANGTIWNANGGGAGGNSGDVGVGIDLDAVTGDVTLGSVQTTSNASTSRGDANDAVSINALAGAVIDGGDTDDDIIANAGETQISASNGIGNGNSLEVQLDRLDATNSTVNDIDIFETLPGGELNIVRVDQNAPVGNVIVLTANGHLTVLAEAVGGNPGNGVEALDGQTFLVAQGGGADDDLVINNQVQSSDGKINLDSSSRDVIASAEGDVTATDGSEIESSAQRHITHADGTVWNANAGGDGTALGGALGAGIDLDAATGSITLGSVQTTSTAATSNANVNDAVDIRATNGGVIDGGDTDDDIIANGVNAQTTIITQNGIGHGNSIETQIDRLDAQNIAGGGAPTQDIDIREQAAGGSLNIVRVDQNAPVGRIDIQTVNGTITILAEALVTNLVNFVGVSALAGETFIRANGGGADDDLIINNQMDSTTGKINVDSSSRDVIASIDGDITATGGAEIESDAIRHITMADGAIWEANGGGPDGSGIDLDAQTGNITLGSVQTTSTADHAVVISTRDGRIIDGGDMDIDIESGAGTGGVLGSGGGMILEAMTGIGSRGTGLNVNPGVAPDALDTMGGRLAAKTESGDIQVFNTGSLEITTLADNNAPTPQGAPGAGNLVGVLIDDPSLIDPTSIIFITALSPIAVSSTVINNDGGNISMYALGNTVADFMNIFANIITRNGSGDIRLMSGGSMTMTNNVLIQTTNAGGASTGDIIMGAGFDATGQTQDASVVSLLQNVTFPFLNTVVPSNGAANMDMQSNAAETQQATAATDDGNIYAYAGNQINIGYLNADGNTDATRGNVTTNSINGSTLDAGLTARDILGEIVNMNSGGSIGVVSNPIEISANFINSLSAAGQFIQIIPAFGLFGSAVINLTALNGGIFVGATGNIFLGRAHANFGEVNLQAGNNITPIEPFGDVQVIAQDRITLTTGSGIIGNGSNPVNTQLNTAGVLNVNAGGAVSGLSANLTGNFQPTSVNVLNALGLVLFNSSFVLGGDNFGDLVTSLFGALGGFNITPGNNSQLGLLDGQWNADFPGAGINFEDFAFGPIISIATDALDEVLDILGVVPAEEEDVPPTTVPIPTPAVTPGEDTTTTDTTTPQDDVPPTTVPIPTDAVPGVDQVAGDQVQVGG